LAWGWASSCRHSPSAASIVADPAADGCLLERVMLWLLLLLLLLIKLLPPFALLPPET
jgi:hypothetical protein